jgi:very-short-patch-repair endonuclease
VRNTDNYYSLPFNSDLRERAKTLRKSGNLSEIKMWRQLHKKKFKGYDFDRQKIIGNYIVDFFCVDCGVVVEIDGSSHDTKEVYDAERNTFLKSLGLTVIHIPAADVSDNLYSVMKMLNEHPALSHPVSQ